jgi:hypothetical protein
VAAIHASSTGPGGGHPRAEPRQAAVTSWNQVAGLRDAPRRNRPLHELQHQAAQATRAP